MSRQWILAAMLGMIGCAGWAGDREKEYIRMASAPDVSPDGQTLAFEWNGEIWRAPVAGGVAVPLTRHAAPDTAPHFSPDGSEIAFSSRRDGDWQVYIMPADGGIPRQVTFHSEGSIALDWYPDGASLLTSGLRDYGPFDRNRMFQVSTRKRTAERLVFNDYGKLGTVSPDGAKVLFVRENPDRDRYRRGYRGSDAAQIWLYDMKAARFTLIHRKPWNCTGPMWMPDGKGFYYLSEQNGLANIWRHDLATGDEKQLTFFKDDPVSSPSVSRDGSTIVFRRLFDVYRFRPADGCPPARIDLWSETDRVRKLTRRRWYTTAWNCDEWGSVDFTENGLETAFTTGGNLWVMDTVLREPRQVTTDSGYHDTDAVFAPDGKSILFLRDSGIGVNLWCARRGEPSRYWWQNSSFVLEPLTKDAHSRSLLTLSPDGKHIAYAQDDNALYIADLDGRNARRFYDAADIVEYVWSPDGKWIAGCFRDSMDNDDIWLVSVGGTVQPVNISRSPHTDRNPAWSPDGKILAYVGGNANDRDPNINYVYLARSDSEVTSRDVTVEKALKVMKPNGAKEGKDKDKDKKADAGRRELPDVKIDLDGLADRVRTLSISATHEAGLFWLEGERLGFYAGVNGHDATYTVEFPDKFTPVLYAEKGGVHMRLNKGGKLAWILDGVPALGTTRYPFSAYQELDLADYRRLGFRKAWQIFRDGFYDGRLNNLDWNAVRLKYEDMAANCPDMAAFDRIVAMMEGELGASHVYFVLNYNEWEKPADPPAWRAETVHLGLRFDPGYAGPGIKVNDVIAKSPADTLESRILPGEVILAIDGTKIAPDTDLTSVLNGRLQRDLMLRVVDAAGKQRDVVLQPISYATARELLGEQEFDQKRHTVDGLGQNRLAYLNIEKMDWSSFDKFERGVFARGVGKDGLVIDVRGNPGGFIADRLLTILCRPQHAITVSRGRGESYPIGYLVFTSWDKPIVVLCDQRSTSNAEIFSHAIKNLKRGKLVGVPTAGDVIATPNVPVLDFGTLHLPHRGFFTWPDGEDMELHGAIPDYLIWPKPGDMPAGKDEQLEKAVEVLLQDVKAYEAAPRKRLIWKSARPGGAVLPPDENTTEGNGK